MLKVMAEGRAFFGLCRPCNSDEFDSIKEMVLRKYQPDNSLKTPAIFDLVDLCLCIHTKFLRTFNNRT